MARNGDTKGTAVPSPGAAGTLGAQSKESLLKKLLVPFLRIQETSGQ